MLAQLDHRVGVDVIANRQLARRDHAFGLVPDIEQDFVLVDLDDSAFDDLAVFDSDQRCFVRGIEGCAHVVFGDRTWVVFAVLVERSERRVGGGSEGQGFAYLGWIGSKGGDPRARAVAASGGPQVKSLLGGS